MTADKLATIKGSPAQRAFLGLLVLCVLVRLGVWLVYEPVRWPDTGTYFRLADQILHWDFTDYDGTRTPVYPLLILLAGGNPSGIWAIQSVLGVLASLLLFWIVRDVSGKPWLAFAAGATHSLALNQVMFEANLLTESVSAFFLILSVFLFSKIMWGERGRYVVGLGVVSALIGLTHPLFAFVGILYAALLVLFLRGRDRMRAPAAVLIIFLIPISGWIAVNKLTLDYTGITTFMGYNLSNHAGGFIEHAPPSEIRDIYLKYREDKIGRIGNHAMTIFEAKEEIQAETGLSHTDLSEVLARISFNLFLAHPLLYLKSVFESWVSFWAVPGYWKPSKVEGDRVAPVLAGIWKVEQWLLRGVNLLFVLMAGGLAARAVLSRGRLAPRLQVGVAIAAVVIATSVVQALFEFGNTRYSIPTQSLAVAFVMMGLWELKGKAFSVGRAVIVSGRKV